MRLNVEIFANYAAGLSTAAFLWKIYKHFTKGAKTKITDQPKANPLLILA
jgi:hypothetical protein